MLASSRLEISLASSNLASFQVGSEVVLRDMPQDVESLKAGGNEPCQSHCNAVRVLINGHVYHLLCHSRFGLCLARVIESAMSEVSRLSMEPNMAIVRAGEKARTRKLGAITWLLRMFAK